MEVFDKRDIVKSDNFVNGKKLFLNSIAMKEKERYFSPETEVMELRLEGVIATSELPGDIPDTITPGGWL